MSYYGYSSYGDTAAVGGILAGLGVFALIISLIGLAIAVVEIIAIVKLFQKAGKPGWAAIVPIYNIIVLLDIIGYKWYYVFAYCASVIPILGGFIALAFSITANIKLAKSFGQSVGYGIGLLLLSPIFIPITAFSKNINYVAPAVKGDIDFNDLF